MARESSYARGHSVTLAEICTRLIESHPYIWRLGWEAIHRLPFLLPHDKSYNALSHFIAIRPNGLFLDIGANDGISALSFRKFSKSYRILSLEPNPLLGPALQKLRSQDPFFDYKSIGAGASASRRTFFVPVYKNIILHTFTSTSRDHLCNAIADSFGRNVASQIDIREFDSEIVPVDTFALSPTIVKIDAEGFDHDVLLGLSETIQRARPFIIVEIAAAEFDSISTYFRERRYTLLAYNLFTHCFISQLTSWNTSVAAMRGHSNFFAVPNDMMGDIPLEPISFGNQLSTSLNRINR